MKQLERDELARYNELTNIHGLVAFVLHMSIVFLALAAFAYFFLQQNYPLVAVTVFFYGFVVSFLGWTGASHEMAHDTVFKTKWLNEVCLNLCCFFTWQNKVYFRQTHWQHHRNTYVKDKDVEVIWDFSFSPHPRPKDIIFDGVKCYRTLRAFLYNACGKIPGTVNIPALQKEGSRARRDMFSFSRGIVFSHAVILSLSVYFGWWPIGLLILLGPFCMTYPSKLLSYAQHFGKNPDSRDYWENTRTVRLNPILEFLYWNMNYHVEHHVHPSVPFYKLPKLQIDLSGSASPRKSLYAVYKEVLQDSRARA